MSILALLSNYDRESCLINVGTEGPAITAASRRIEGAVSPVGFGERPELPQIPSQVRDRYALVGAESRESLFSSALQPRLKQRPGSRLRRHHGYWLNGVRPETRSGRRAPKVRNPGFEGSLFETQRRPIFDREFLGHEIREPANRETRIGDNRIAILESA